MRPGFKSRKRHLFIYFFFLFFFIFLIYLFFVCFFFLSLLLQCKFANSTLLSLLSFSYFITPYDAQASSAFSALIHMTDQKIRRCLPGRRHTALRHSIWLYHKRT